MTILIRLLVLLGVVAELWVVIGLWADLRADGSAGEFAVFLSPLPVAALAAALAGWLRRRGSGWAWLAAGVPAVLLGLVLGAAVLLTIFPLHLHQP